MSEHIKQFLDQIMNGQNSEARESLENVLSAKAFDALDTHKKEIASSLFSDKEETSTEEQVDSQEEQTEE